MANEDLVNVSPLVNVKQKNIPSPIKQTSPRNQEDEDFKSHDSLSDDEDKAIEVEIIKDFNQEVYVLPTFFHPGRHSYVVRYLNQQGKEEEYFHTLVAPPRHEDIPPCNLLSFSCFI
jgi:hypothetical protein